MIRLDIQKIDSPTINEVIQLYYFSPHGVTRHIGAYYGRRGKYTSVIASKYLGKSKSARLTREEVLEEANKIIEGGIR